MLNIVQDILDELSSFLTHFSDANNLPICVIDKSLFFGSQSNDVCGKNSNKCVPNTVRCCSVRVQLKSSEKQHFDLRLLFGAIETKVWWPHLSALASKLAQFDGKYCQIKRSVVLEPQHSIDILLIRSKLLCPLLSELSEPSSRLRTLTDGVGKHVSVMKFAAEFDNYLTKERVNMVCKLIDGLLSHYGGRDDADNDALTISASSDFDQFAASNNFDAMQSSIELNNSISRSIDACSSSARYLALIDRYLSVKFGSSTTAAHNSNVNAIIIIIVVASERVFTRVKQSIEIVRRRLRLDVPAGRRFTFKLLNVSQVSPTTIDRAQIDDASAKINPRTIASFEQYKKYLQDCGSIIGDISPENLDPIARTMLAFSLLTAKLNSPILALTHNHRHESIFVQYNIARIKSILGKFALNYGDEKHAQNSMQTAIQFGLLTHDHEWNLVWICLTQMELLNRAIFRRFTTCSDFSVERIDFECNRVTNALKMCAHAFSGYYRNVKILSEPVAVHLATLRRARVSLCEAVLRQINFYFTSLDIVTAERM